MLSLRVTVYWRGIPRFPNLHSWNLAIGWFSIISRSLVGGVLLLCRDAIRVFYRTCRLGYGAQVWRYSRPRHRGDSASNPQIVPLVGYIFRWHDRFVTCPRCVFFFFFFFFKIQTTDHSLVWIAGQRGNELNGTIKKVKKRNWNRCQEKENKTRFAK